jgi:hypothetical protein
MDLKIDPIILKRSNYAEWEPYMETILKCKGLWKYMKIVIPDPTYDHANFYFNGKKDEVVGVMKTYISREIQFYFNGINFPHQFWKKIKLLFD